MSKQNYMEELDSFIDQGIARVVESFKEPETQFRAEATAFKKAIKDKVLESFRNGQRSRRSKKENEPTSETK